jgi:hypothetical protein
MITHVDFEYFTTNPKLTDEWAIGVLEAAAAQMGSKLVFHLNTTELESEIPCPDCHAAMMAHA